MSGAVLAHPQSAAFPLSLRSLSLSSLDRRTAKTKRAWKRAEFTVLAAVQIQHRAYTRVQSAECSLQSAESRDPREWRVERADERPFLSGPSPRARARPTALTPLRNSARLASRRG